MESYSPSSPHEISRLPPRLPIHMRCLQEKFSPDSQHLWEKILHSLQTAHMYEQTTNKDRLRPAEEAARFFCGHGQVVLDSWHEKFSRSQVLEMFPRLSAEEAA